MTETLSIMHQKSILKQDIKNSSLTRRGKVCGENKQTNPPTHKNKKPKKFEELYPF